MEGDGYNGDGLGLSARLANAIAGDPLFVTFRATNTNEPAPLNTAAATVYLGIGICGRNGELSTGLPFDAVGYLAAMETIRRKLEIGSCNILVADTHAAANTNHRPAEVADRACTVMNQLQAVCGSLGVPARFLMGSEIDKTELYDNIYRYVTASTPSDYARREIADIAWIQSNYPNIVKVGWMLGSKAGASDETFFDDLFNQARPPFVPGLFSSVYTVCGRTSASNRPNVCPYTFFPDQADYRISLFDGSQEVEISKSVAKHLHNVCDLYERLVGWSHGTDDVRVRVSRIIERIQDYFTKA